MTAIRLEGLRKEYGRGPHARSMANGAAATIAVDSIDLVIESGELFFLLGPSGCGKTTVLRMIAGFIEPTAGRIYFDDEDVTQIAPNKRNTGMVFQNYALWPHMSVFDNVAYGLGVRKVGRKERGERTMAALRTVQMHDYRDRKPAQLSGGQQQRIALARALVIRPTVLLLDEPLSNLDAKLRLEMRDQIRRICAETGITTVYVTHDQKESLSLADRIAVMRAGRVMQIGKPADLYCRPHSRFVADFLGETNFVHAVVTSAENGRVILETPIGPLSSTAYDESTPAGGNVTCSIRPESIRVIEGTGGEGNILSGKRERTIFLGEFAYHLIALADGTVLKVLEVNPARRPHSSDRIRLSIPPDEVVILPD